MPRIMPILSAGSGAFPTATPFWDASPRRKNRPFSTAADFPADDRTVKAAGHGRFLGRFHGRFRATNIVPAACPV
jgi:hypothetical protein